jgi:hypothetical protein
MTLREWLPDTPRNRVALLLALASLVMFCIWNFMPHYNMRGHPQDGIVAMHLWPEVLSPDSYINAMRSKDPEDILGVIASLTVILTALICVLTIPLWRVIHASAFLRLPPAIMTLIGGLVIGWFLIDALMVDANSTHEMMYIALLLISLNMLATSAALFLMRHEPPRNPALAQYAPDASEKM